MATTKRRSSGLWTVTWGEAGTTELMPSAGMLARLGYRLEMTGTFPMGWLRYGFIATDVDSRKGQCTPTYFNDTFTLTRAESDRIAHELAALKAWTAGWGWKQ